MSKAAKKIRNDPGEVREPSKAEEALDRSEELSTKKDVEEALLDIYKDIEKGFDNQAERSDSNMDMWDVYNCVLNQNQFYSGTSKIFVPIVHSAVEARKTRFVNQMFPMSGRYVEVTSEDGKIPHAEMALLEHYVRSAKMRTRVAPSLVKNGDIEGQMTVQVTWEERTRHVAYRTKKPPQVDGEDVEAEEDVEDIKEEEIVSGGPVVTVIPDSDFLVLPATVDSLDQALAEGGSVTTLCRWSQAKLKRKMKEGEVRDDVAEGLLEELKNDKIQQRPDKGKEMVDAAGIKGDARGKYILLYRTWCMLTIDGERRLCLSYLAGKDRVLSCKRNPYWSDRIDVISAPVDKVDGCFKGISKVSCVADLQYQANDACNEGMDSAAYALMPIIMTDPEKNPKIGQMILSMAAVWETSPNDTQFARFPELWKDALEIVAITKQEIFQALSVNPAQITGATEKKQKRPNQAEIANEQQIDILTTGDAVTVTEDEILTPVLRTMLELDHQYRDKRTMVREYGETGARSAMVQIPPTQMNKLYQFRWFGVEAARGAQQMQQQIAGLNVIKGIPPQMYKNYTVDLGPALSQMVENLFGPRLGPLTFKDARDEYSLDPMEENKMMAQGFLVPVHILDDHMQHIKMHQQLAQSPDPEAKAKAQVHIKAHINAVQEQQMQQMQQSQGQPPGGQGQGGGPRQGAQPQQPRGGQAPPGAIHQDRMRDPMVAPRR